MSLSLPILNRYTRAFSVNETADVEVLWDDGDVIAWDDVTLMAWD